MTPDEEKEIKEVFEDTLKVQDALNRGGITNLQFLHALPVILNEIYPNKEELIKITDVLVQQILQMHKIIEARKSNFKVKLK